MRPLAAICSTVWTFAHELHVLKLRRLGIGMRGHGLATAPGRCRSSARDRHGAVRIDLDDST